MRKLEHLVIVGGGFSGVALAAELVKRRAHMRISIVEGGARIGRGVAYDTAIGSHLLNTRAVQMSVHADDREHFVRWCRRRGCTTSGSDFLPRQLYGEYLEDSLRELCNAESAANVTVHLLAEAVDAVPNAERFEVRLADRRALVGDALAVATGHPAPIDPLAGALPAAARYIRNPWRRDAYAAIGTADRVLLIGTGLTAVDAVLALEEAGHRGPVHAVSRRGLLPRAHFATREPLPADLQAELATGIALNNLRGITATVRRVSAKAEARGCGWQAVLDALRPATPRIWSSLCPADRGRFVRLLRPFFDVHRHRMPPVVAGRIAALRARGRLRVTAGRLANARDEGDSVVVEYAERATGSMVRERYDWVVNCTGSSFTKESCRPFERRLIERGLLLPDPLGLGYVTCEAGGAIGARGPVDNLFVLGPACRANFWEHTAVPELRAQAVVLADRLLAAASTSRPIHAVASAARTGHAAGRVRRRDVVRAE